MVIISYRYYWHFQIYSFIKTDQFKTIKYKAIKNNLSNTENAMLFQVMFATVHAVILRGWFDSAKPAGVKKELGQTEVQRTAMKGANTHQKIVLNMWTAKVFFKKHTEWLSSSGISIKSMNEKNKADVLVTVLGTQ